MHAWFKGVEPVSPPTIEVLTRHVQIERPELVENLSMEEDEVALRHRGIFRLLEVSSYSMGLYADSDWLDMVDAFPWKDLAPKHLELWKVLLVFLASPIFYGTLYRKDDAPDFVVYSTRMNQFLALLSGRGVMA